MDAIIARQQLQSTDTWCVAADYLAQQGDPQAIRDLIAAYNLPYEASRLCLLDAIEALDPTPFVIAEWNNADHTTRFMLMQVMELCPDSVFVPRLVQLIHNADGLTQQRALQVLRTQRQDAQWEDAVIDLLNHTPPDIRRQLISMLIKHKSSEKCQQALRHHLEQETEPDIRAKITQGLNT